MSLGESLFKTRQLLVGERRTTAPLFAMSTVASLENYICNISATHQWRSRGKNPEIRQWYVVKTSKDVWLWPQRWVSAHAATHPAGKVR